MIPKILCDIGERIVFNTGGSGRAVRLSDLEDDENIGNIFRIQFSKKPTRENLSAAIRTIRENPAITLRFYGDYSEDDIDWDALQAVTKLQIDLWEVRSLYRLSELTNLSTLGITKNIKSSASLKILEPLHNLRQLFVSISKDVEAIGCLRSLQFLSLREIKKDDLKFLRPLQNLGTLWVSLGSYSSFDTLAELGALQQLSLHQVKGLNDSTIGRALTNNHSIESLELQNLKHVTSLEFIGSMKALSYLSLDGMKELATFSPIAGNESLETLSISNSKPADRDLSALRKLQNLCLGDIYSREAIANFVQCFEGRSFWYRGNDIVGKFSDAVKSPFRLMI